MRQKAKVVASPFQLDPLNKIARGFAHTSSKDAMKMKRRKTGYIGKLIEVNLFGNMIRNVIDGPMDFFAREEN